MLMAETLPNTFETCAEMREICSQWEHFAKAKLEGLGRSKVQRCYHAVKGVCEHSFYRFRDMRLKGVYVDVVYDIDLHVLGFALSKVIELSHYTFRRPQRLLFLQYMTADPSRIENPDRKGKVGEVLIERLKERSKELELDGVFSEPVLGILPYFMKRHGFADTKLERETPGDKVPRRGILWQRA
ncbi:MAG: hypothetical protein SP1CHLAM54_14770 [Chlamydiia bacterium]|nr:hypothetical protein [Chlamydiia bacterium]MCH9616367.1 hypothetical protein [Chlamydiia bacterium]MCH9629647.1 hypothetical protein [Chlamydiia bacterium]